MKAGIAPPPPRQGQKGKRMRIRKMIQVLRCGGAKKKRRNTRAERYIEQRDIAVFELYKQGTNIKGNIKRLAKCLNKAKFGLTYRAIYDIVMERKKELSLLEPTSYIEEENEPQKQPINA